MQHLRAVVSLGLLAENSPHTEDKLVAPTVNEARSGKHNKVSDYSFVLYHDAWRVILAPLWQTISEGSCDLQDRTSWVASLVHVYTMSEYLRDVGSFDTWSFPELILTPMLPTYNMRSLYDIRALWKGCYIPYCFAHISIHYFADIVWHNFFTDQCFITATVFSPLKQEVSVLHMLDY